MSVHVISWVLQQSEARLGDRLVLLVLADHAKADGSGAWPSVETIAREARLSRSQAQRCLRRLEAEGHIARTAVSRMGTVVWTVVMQGAAICGGGAASTTEGGRNTRPEPSEEPSSEGANAPSPGVRISGVKVVAAHWELALRVLDAFNEHSGRKYRQLKSSGQPSEAATYVYKRIREYPDLTFEEHVGIIERTLASRWWGDETPSFNVVYGPRVFEENITRPGIRRASRVGGAEAERRARQEERAERIRSRRELSA